AFTGPDLPASRSERRRPNARNILSDECELSSRREDDEEVRQDCPRQSSWRRAHRGMALAALSVERARLAQMDLSICFLQPRQDLAEGVRWQIATTANHLDLRFEKQASRVASRAMGARLRDHFIRSACRVDARPATERACLERNHRERHAS